MIEFSVDGGFANLARSISIASDGTVDRVRSRQASSGQLTAEQVAAIVAELDQSGLFDRDREYPPPPGAADLQRYQISYRGVTVVSYDTTVPAELAGAIGLLEQALAA